MYNMHKYFARKTHNVVGEYIKRYSKAGEIVLDPFCGSGVANIEALKSQRKTIAIDFSPVATFITRMTGKRVESSVLGKLVNSQDEAVTEFVADVSYIGTFRRIMRTVRTQAGKLYETKCPLCGSVTDLTCMIWSDVVKCPHCNGEVPLFGSESEVERLFTCPHCGKAIDLDTANTIACRPVEIRIKKCSACGQRTKSKALDPEDVALLEKIQMTDVPSGCPTDEFPTGQETLRLLQRGINRVADLFTKRNLLVLTLIKNEIDKLGEGDVKDLLRLSLSSMVHLASKMTVVRPSRPFSSAWVQQSYWIPPVNMESNVMFLFENAVVGKDGVYKGKLETLSEIPRSHEAKSFTELRKAKSKANILIQTESCIDAMRRLPQSSIDYIFTDPPYGGSIQYGELLFLWASWLGFTQKYPSYEQMTADEIIVNDYQSKSFDDYYKMMHAAFGEMNRVLKPSRYMTVTFHNPEFRVRNSIIRAAVFAGFDFEKILYQPPARPSAKGLLQPFGSLEGDYYLRFRKPRTIGRKRAADAEEVAESHLESIVVETAKKIVAERGEATPFTFIQNAIDPLLYSELRKHGLLVEYEPENVETILKRHLDDVFVLVRTSINGRRGKAWWLKDSAHIKVIPLNKRVEETIVNFLNARIKATFTEILTELYTRYKNALTPDSQSIVAILNEVAVKSGERMWRLKPSTMEFRRAHEEMIYYLGIIGRKLGYKVGIAIDECRKTWNGRRLADLLKVGRAPSFPNVPKWNMSRIRRIDVIWFLKDKVDFAFEVEYSTTINDAVLRGSNLPWKETRRCIVIPKARANFMARRLREPAIQELMGQWTWQAVSFEDLRDLFTKVKGLRGVSKREFEDIIGRAPEKPPEEPTLDQFT
jgi:16S rRNA G966 N2-methylase RsmD/DNA-directed RNA polymerase subunit RPC12/RpoP